MEWFTKPTTMDEVAKSKKSALQVMLLATVLLCILTIAGIVGVFAKLSSVVIGVLLGLGLVRWLRARRVEEELVAKAKKESGSTATMVDAIAVESVDQPPNSQV